MVLQIGKTKVFLKAGQMAELDAKRAKLLGHSAEVIQSQHRRRVSQKHYITLVQAAVCIQSSCRGELIGKHDIYSLVRCILMSRKSVQSCG